MFDLILTPVALLFAGLGMPELLFILLILVVIFGAAKLPQLGRGLGEGIRNFKQGVKDSDPERIDDGSSSSDRPA